MKQLKWWQQAVFYQIYPRSFADGNDDGIGDFPGMTAHLDYLHALGVDALWLSPHFPSPQADCGYDISDYTGVAPEYGTLDDFTTFLHAAHARDMRVILDLVLNHTSDEHPDLPDHTSQKAPADLLNANALTMDDYRELMRYQVQQPGVHELMQELRTVLDEYPGDRVLVGEDEDVAYHGSGDDELHLVFNFPLMRVKRLTPAHIRANQTMRLAELPPDAWPCNTLGNHDSPRVWSRYGDGVHDAELARLHLALMLTLKGTPFLYNGEEIGMADLELDDLSQFRDTAALRYYRLITELLQMSPQEALQAVAMTTRDRCRTPMQWSAEVNAGFSAAGVESWLPVNPNYMDGVNVAVQEDDPASFIKIAYSPGPLCEDSYQLLFRCAAGGVTLRG